MASRGKKSEFRSGSVGTPEINETAEIPHQNHATVTPWTLLKNRKRQQRRDGVLTFPRIPLLSWIFGGVSTVPTINDHGF